MMLRPPVMLIGVSIVWKSTVETTIIAMFFILPAFIFLLSLAGTVALYSVVIPATVVLTFTSIVNALQSYR